MPQIIRAESDADFIAMVPALLGMRPTRSLALVMFCGTQSVGAARLDLPTGRSTRELRAIADVCVNLASRSNGIDRVATVIFTDTTFEGEQGIPWVDLTRVIEQRMQRAGFGIIAQLCVAADGWGNALAKDDGRGPRLLSEITESSSARHVEGFDIHDPREWGALPEPEPWLQEQIDEYLDLNLAHWESPVALDDSWPDVISTVDAEALHDLIELVVSRPAEAMGALEIATLATYASLPSWRDTLMLQMAFGRRIGRRAADSHRFWNAARERRGGTMDEVVATAMANGDVGDGDDEALLGDLMTGESAMRPGLDRCTNAIGALLRAAANVESDLQPGLLCMASWLSWAIGRASASHALIEQALTVDPHHRMSHIVHALVGSGRVPEWMFAAREPDEHHAR